MISSLYRSEFRRSGPMQVHTPPRVRVNRVLMWKSLAVSGAIFLILEMYAPYGGMIQVADAPLRAVLLHLGQ